MIKETISKWEDVLDQCINLTYKYLEDYPQAWTKKTKKKTSTYYYRRNNIRYYKNV